MESGGQEISTLKAPEPAMIGRGDRNLLPAVAL